MADHEPEIFPTQGRIAVIATSTTAATTNLAAAAQLGTRLCSQGLWMLIQADADVYAKLAFAAGTEVSDTNTDNDSRGWLLEAKKPYKFKFENKHGLNDSTGPALNTFLSLKAAAGNPLVRVAAIGRQHG